MSNSPSPPELFVERVMGEVARQKRRLPLVVVALALSTLVLAVPALLVFLARPALDAAVAFTLLGLGELISATADNPIFWVGAGIGLAWLAWLAWLASRALGGGR